MYSPLGCLDKVLNERQAAITVRISAQKNELNFEGNDSLPSIITSTLIGGLM